MVLHPSRLFHAAIAGRYHLVCCAANFCMNAALHTRDARVVEGRWSEGGNASIHAATQCIHTSAQCHGMHNDPCYRSSRATLRHNQACHAMPCHALHAMPVNPYAPHAAHSCCTPSSGMEL